MPFYSPGPVPQDVRGLPAYLNNEFERISNVLNGAVKLAFGGLFQIAPTVVVALSPVPVAFAPYDTILPAGSEPQGTLPVILDGSITILSAGIYSVLFSTTGVNVPVNSDYEFVIYKNGIPGPARGIVDPSNQTDRITISMTGIVEYLDGDVIQVFAASQTDDDWTSTSATFQVFRISDAQD